MYLMLGIKSDPTIATEGPNSIQDIDFSLAMEGTYNWKQGGLPKKKNWSELDINQISLDSLTPTHIWYNTLTQNLKI